MEAEIIKNKELYEQLCKVLQQPDIYNIICALRGPDQDNLGTELIKEWTACRLRGLLGLGGQLVLINLSQLTEHGAEIIANGEKTVGPHYLNHYSAACRAFDRLFGYDPAKVSENDKGEAEKDEEIPF